MTESPPRILADIRDEAESIGTEVAAVGLPARLLGGVAFWLRCPSVRSGTFARDYADLDFAVSKPAGQRFRAILEGRLPAGQVLQRAARRDQAVLRGAGRAVVG